MEMFAHVVNEYARECISDGATEDLVTGIVHENAEVRGARNSARPAGDAGQGRPRALMARSAQDHQRSGALTE